MKRATVEVTGDVLAQLAETPRWLRGVVDHVPAHAVSTPPEAGGFSVVEHVWHLADLEAEGYGVRIARLLAEDRPALPDFEGDRIARERRYRERSVPEGLAAFAAARARNVARLRGVSEDAWERDGVQDGVGPVCLQDVARMMAEHDAGHRAEIDALVAALGPR
jgi:hypothetical protein